MPKRVDLSKSKAHFTSKKWLIESVRKLRRKKMPRRKKRGAKPRNWKLKGMMQRTGLSMPSFS